MTKKRFKPFAISFPTQNIKKLKKFAIFCLQSLNEKQLIKLFKLNLIY